ncbi:poly-beta-1,6-N-acetyl-D-glucosamine biosynthesis protein PgaD [Neopusillimonas maritima]|uniref:Poly-beta-1,6-N-acetyl-D-glucosamine biosynthesis protein PgaD n=1 Tax=Neopusillimonas maritima TaxID=2026239 RepID=A0ABX9MYB1_9BURK|nr:poly-beta-1,6-N-acetyl-D-glucosamine biosynthesis protein PgaD [Neopusillimonas maritima]RII83044.1 poly-beta-1,6-N-acetyl-D-glucosamine biosynthesis protein PgaD [Neopusillimonas maritima]
MIIQTQRPWHLIVLDTVLTVIAWAGFLALFVMGFKSLWAMLQNHNPEYLVNEVIPLINTFGFYTILGILNALILFFWARYNIYRFRGKERRKPIENLNQDGLLHSFNISHASLQALHENKVVVIHHQPDGSVAAVQTLQ